VTAEVVAATSGADDVAEVAEVTADDAVGAGEVPALHAPRVTRPVSSTAVESAMRFIAIHFVGVAPGLIPGRRG
jgi:hypothetical protein